MLLRTYSVLFCRHARTITRTYYLILLWLAFPRFSYNGLRYQSQFQLFILRTVCPVLHIDLYHRIVRFDHIDHQDETCNKNTVMYSYTLLWYIYSIPSMYMYPVLTNRHRTDRFTADSIRAIHPSSHFSNCQLPIADASGFTGSSLFGLPVMQMAQCLPRMALVTPLHIRPGSPTGVAPLLSPGGKQLERL